MRWLWVAVGVLSLAVAGLGYEVYDLRQDHHAAVRQEEEDSRVLLNTIVALRKSVGSTQSAVNGLTTRLGRVDGGHTNYGYSFDSLADRVDGLSSCVTSIYRALRFNTAFPVSC